MPGVEAFEAAELALDSEADINPGMEQLQATTRAIARAVKDPATRARVDQVIRSKAFADFKKAMNSFLSPDGKAARFIISHRGDPATPEGIARIDKIRTAAQEALKTTPLESANVYLAGTASTFKDFHDGAKYDLYIAGIGALCLIFIIMLVLTRSFVAALVIVGTREPAKVTTRFLGAIAGLVVVNVTLAVLWT